MNARQISPSRLLVTSLTCVRPIYVQLLAFYIPSLVIAVIKLASGSPESGVAFILDGIDNFFIFPFIDGAATFYTYQHLRHTAVSIPNSLQRSGEKYVSLFLINLFNQAALQGMSGSLESVESNSSIFLVVFPLIYVGTCLTCTTYLIVIEDRNISRAASRSWELVSGKWWYIFRSLFYALAVFFGVYVILWFITRQDILSDGTIWSDLCIFLSQPISTVYLVLVFISLLNEEARSSQKVTSQN
jgi:hypothetical protein